MNQLLCKINEAANNWNKTKDKKYKKEWYGLLAQWFILYGK
jgi:hypothetical protein